ncbi:hypothetical protein [Natronorubrum daqingense]|uniref:Hsp20/alpha crystallin family protein n=1 Tax=Natronorubrum daqingense TaxID=588898 RepID=A0A1N7AB42_9EURY|nr:hypothetical protein [Natronorubrum daqingense]APX98046.1 hypothetical protein BB347_16285 [Natronorubrum daqingense]SIR36380.1 hypothetical protein SAMN05421809_1102 [Natronorubrum daqingense]
MFQPRPAETGSFPFPVRVQHDRPANEFRLVADIYPTQNDDLTVHVGTNRVRLAVASGDAVFERTIAPLPSRRVFGDDHRGAYNNGVLTLTLETRVGIR